MRSDRPVSWYWAMKWQVKTMSVNGRLCTEKKNNLHCSLTLMDSQLAIAALGGHIKSLKTSVKCLVAEPSGRKSYKVGIIGKTMRIPEFQYLKWSQNCAYDTQSWQMSWRESLGRRSLLTACFSCKVNVDWGADIQLAWAHVIPSGQHLLEAVVSPALLIIAQVSPTSFCYFFSKN